MAGRHNPAGQTIAVSQTCNSRQNDKEPVYALCDATGLILDQI